jgi:hypothetical protein
MKYVSGLLALAYLTAWLVCLVVAAEHKLAFLVPFWAIFWSASVLCWLYASSEQGEQHDEQ